MVETKHLDAIADHIQFLINAMSQPVVAPQESALVGLKKSLTEAFNAIEGVEVKGSDNSNEEFKKSLESLDKSVASFKEGLSASENKFNELDSKIETFTKIVKDLNERFNFVENKLKESKPSVTIKVFKGKEEINGVELEYSAAKLPKKHYDSDSGFDGFVCFPDGFQTEEVIQPGETKKIPLGIQCQIPDGYEIQVRPRSGKTGDRINVGWGTVDSNEVCKVLVSNKSNEPYTVKQGDKICQLVICEVFPAVMEFTGNND